MSRVKTNKNVQNNRSYSNIRSKLKKRLRNGAILDKYIIRKYHLDNLTKYRRNKRIPEEMEKIDIPKVLCLIENHDKTLSFLNQLEKILTWAKPKNIHFNHKKTKKIGLAASYLFNQIIKEYKEKWSARWYTIEFSGVISQNKEVNNFMVAFGLLRTLNIYKKFGPDLVDNDYLNKYVTFKYSGNNRYRYMKGNASTKLADYFRNCLRHNGLSLSYPTYCELAGAFGEIIANAEEHSHSKKTEWDVMGFYDKSAQHCKFAIINKGNTIYENLLKTDAVSKEIKQTITDVSNKFAPSHKVNLDRRFDEPIWNVIALQDGISSKRKATGKNSTRGQGLMDVVKFIDDISNKANNPIIVILSGKSKIVIDYDYPIINKNINGENRRIISFNKEKNLQNPPDNKKVLLLYNSFQGMITTGSFKIDDKFLKKSI